MPHSDSSHLYKRRVLVTISGLTPQVITETIYALCKLDIPFIPTELHIITTTTGAERVNHQLIDRGWYQALAEELDISLPPLESKNIHVIDHATGEYSDVLSVKSTTDTSDDITRVIQEISKDEVCAIHASITGGRKTMGFYLGHAMSLFGRKQDRLSHVVASSQFEHHSDFFFPTSQSNVIYSNTHTKDALDTKDAEVSLIDIPFVRLRHGLPLELLSEEYVSYSMLVDAAQENFTIPKVTIVKDSHKVVIDGEVIRMSSQYFAWYYWMAKERKERYDKPNKGYSRYDEDGVKERFKTAYLEVDSEASHGYEQAEISMSNDERWRDFFREKGSLIKKLLHRELGPRAKPYCIDTAGKRPYTVNGLNILPENISIVDRLE